MTITGTPIDYLVAFFAGLAVSLTPCVYPLIPVVAATIAGSNTSGRHSGAVWLSLLYVLGLATCYSILALVAALTGQIFGSFQNSPWVFFVMGNFLLLFGLIMLDVIPFPNFHMGGMMRKRGALAIFSLGFASGFLVGPCTTPVLGALLLFVAEKQNFVFGVTLLLVFSVGMAASLLLAGVFSGFLTTLPRAGVWMVRIKKLAGFVLLGFAEFYLIKAGQLFG